jgi:hypothetical protein
VESFIWEKIPWNLIDQNTSDWNKNETMQKLMLATEAGPAYLSWAPGFTSGFSRVRVTRSLVLCVCFVDRCLSFCYFLLTIVLSVLLTFINYDYPFGIFKLFKIQIWLNIAVKTLNLGKILMSHYWFFFYLYRLTTRFLTSVILGGLLARSVYPFRSLYFTPRFNFFYFYFCCCIPLAKSSVFSVVLFKSLSVGFFVFFGFFCPRCLVVLIQLELIVSKYKFIAIYTKLSRNSSLPF